MTDTTLTASSIITNPLTWARPARAVVERFGAPVLNLAIRVWMAQVFFSSGLTKIRDWESTLFLFEFEYAVPILPHSLTASLATVFELGMPVLLVAGLFTRFAALPLIAMTLVIQFVLGAANPAYDNVLHFYWLFLLIILVIRGPGALSADHWIAKWIERRAA